MNAALRAFVRERAGRRCEYCRLHEDDADFLSFHVEHVVAKQHGGTDDPDILGFACAECNWAKGPNLAGLLDGKLYPLFRSSKPIFDVTRYQERIFLRFRLHFVAKIFWDCS